MAKVKTPTDRINLPTNGKKITQHANGNGAAAHHGGPTTNGGAKKTGNKKGGTINWLSHWERDDENRKVIIEFPAKNCTKAEFKRLIKDYINSWLAVHNIYNPPEKRHQLLISKLRFKFIKNDTEVKVRAFLNPDPELKDEADHDHHHDEANGAKGGGHLIPPEPPPPPPGSDSLR